MSAGKKPIMVEVEWLDARTFYEQMTVKDAQDKCKLCRRFTMGYVIVKDKERLVVAHTYDPPDELREEDQAADFTVIPRGWVQRITELVPAERQTDSA